MSRKKNHASSNAIVYSAGSDEILEAQGYFRHENAGLVRTFVRSYSKDLWSLLDKFGVPEDGQEPCAKEFNKRLINIHNECLGRSEEMFRLKVEELERLWERFLCSQCESFEQFLADLCSFEQVHAPDEAALAAIDAQKIILRLPSYRSELKKINEYSELAQRSIEDTAEGHAIRSRILITFVEYVSTVGLVQATFEGWACLGWAVDYRKTPHDVIIASNQLLNELLVKRNDAGADGT